MSPETENMTTDTYSLMQVKDILRGKGNSFLLIVEHEKHPDTNYDYESQTGVYTGVNATMKFCILPEQLSVKIKDEGQSIDILINSQHKIRTTNNPSWNIRDGPVNLSLHKEFVTPAFGIHDIPQNLPPDKTELYFGMDAINYTNQLKYFEEITKSIVLK